MIKVTKVTPEQMHLLLDYLLQPNGLKNGHWYSLLYMLLFIYFLLTSAFPSPLAALSVQIISSATPCGDFFFRCCRSSESQQVDVASARTSSSTKTQGSVPPMSRTTDITNMAKKCNELDLNIIIIWKVCVTQPNNDQLHDIVSAFVKPQK